ncbi:MAG: hypothetical protein VKL59_19330 [Nostocaceae cyanobacterium]|nr:hypothetical protein [Nostocaceae cyanobacterium]
MLKDFLAGTDEIPSAPTPADTHSEPSPSRVPIKLLLIGSHRGVTSTINTLYLLGFAQVGEWSPLLPGPNPGEVMSILVRYLIQQ